MLTNKPINFLFMKMLVLSGLLTMIFTILVSSCGSENSKTESTQNTTTTDTTGNDDSTQNASDNKSSLEK